MKIGALRQWRLPVSSTGRGRRRCPCSASLYLPQAALGCAARRPLDVPPALRARPHMGALGHSMFPYPAALPELLDRVLRLLRSLHPEGAVEVCSPRRGDAAQGQRSVFCKRAPSRTAKTGHRNPEGLDHKSKSQHFVQKQKSSPGQKAEGAVIGSEPRRGAAAGRGEMPPASGGCPPSQAGRPGRVRFCDRPAGP